MNYELGSSLGKAQGVAYAEMHPIPPGWGVEPASSLSPASLFLAPNFPIDKFYLLASFSRPSGGWRVTFFFSLFGVQKRTKWAKWVRNGLARLEKAAGWPPPPHLDSSV